MKIAPSVLAGDLANLTEMLQDIEANGCDLVHFDVMDGHFVPNLTFGPPLIKAARRHTKLPFDVHLMVTNPADYLESLADLGLKNLSFHIEVTNSAPRMINRIRELGMRPSIALNPQTGLTAIEQVLPLIDNVMIMGVDPGFAGQQFISPVFNKVESLVEYREENELVFTIEVDGGVNENNLSELGAIGVDIVVAGKAYFSAPDRKAFVQAVQATLGG